MREQICLQICFIVVRFILFGGIYGSNLGGVKEVRNFIFITSTIDYPSEDEFENREMEAILVLEEILNLLKIDYYNTSNERIIGGALARRRGTIVRRARDAPWGLTTPPWIENMWLSINRAFRRHVTFSRPHMWVKIVSDGTIAHNIVV
ncbi:crossover junction endodeoxyribonuclease RuvC [Striga asiatica]|uniref:Crossover junction endodeoxyribonuclease RuvC n=1 Tax=Striga asiatica TaxID=4170 RepID=A0A5A7QYH8_STRAF|nr:crossover junction endodeoxyribonuclease RuvC [Striga asiatica]